MNNYILKYHLKISLFLILATMFLACETEFTGGAFFEEESKSIIEYIKSNEDSYSRFYELIKIGELESTLKAYNPTGSNYTLFLPTNEAIDKFLQNNQSYDDFQDLAMDIDYVKSLVRFHTVNMAIEKKDFYFGALPDTTLSGEILSVGYSGSIDSTIVKINNNASIIQADIRMANGYIHTIDEVLEPVVWSSYEWLKLHSDYSIFMQALEITGLKDTFKIEEYEEETKFPANTLLIESNEIFGKNGIFSIDDLIDNSSPDQSNYTSYSNGLYQFVAYHILERKRFLIDFEGKSINYNTYASSPISIDATGLDIKINTGVNIFETIINNNDTSVINFVRIDYNASNVITENGAIHFITDVMEPFTPTRKSKIFEFYEEPLISAAQESPGSYKFDDPETLEVINWQGVEEIKYVKSSSNLTDVSNNDYLNIDGAFKVSYQIPKFLPGRYMLRIRAKGNAFIQIYFDGQRIGGNIDLGGGMNTYDIGQVNNNGYEKHLLEINTLIPGTFTWDYVEFGTITNY